MMKLPVTTDDAMTTARPVVLMMSAEAARVAAAPAKMPYALANQSNGNPT
jgi:hypothetical protein